MENAPELTEEMLVQQLTGACEEQIKALWVTSRAHENLFGPLDAEREQESDTLLRLRNVYCHAIAATSCPVDEWAIHAMAPDIRAAFGQLKTLVSDGVCAEVHEPGERDCPMPRCFSTWDGLLAPFSHPTSVVLMFYSGAGGLRKDDVRCLSKLCSLLFGLSSCYALSGDSAASDRIAPAGSRHPPHRTGRAPFKASGSPSDGLDQSREHQPSAIVVGCIHPFSGVVRSVPHPSDCPPSPCGRLSRPRTTTGALPHDRHWPKLAYSVAGEPNMVPKFT